MRLGCRDASVFEHLVVRHSVALHGYLERRAPGAADDLLSEVWLTAFARRADYDPALGVPRAWFFGIARMQLLAHYRRQRLAEPTAEAGVDVDGGWEAVDARLDAARVAPQLRAALGALPAIDRELLLLNAWEELTPTEAATALGIPAGTARSRLHRARVRMKAHLEVAAVSPTGASNA